MVAILNFQNNNIQDNIASDISYENDSNYQLLEASTNSIKNSIAYRSISISVPLNGSRLFIAINDLIAIEADSNYSVLHTINGKKILTSKTLKHWHEKINNSNLIRVHSKYLINRKHIQSIERKHGTITMTNAMEVMCSRRCRKTILFNISNTIIEEYI